MARALGFKAKNAAFKLTERLIASGHLTKSVGGRLVPGSGFFTLDLGDDEVRAGFGAEGSATGLVQAQALDQLLVGRPSKTVFVKVRGDSMVGAGILSGDLAVVETSLQAVNGDIVVAEIDGCHTIKEFRIHQGRPSLVPHGVDTKAVAPEKTLNIVGVVRGIVRSYRPSAMDKAALSRQGALR
jgi:repressor LexA